MEQWSEIRPLYKGCRGQKDLIPEGVSTLKKAQMFDFLNLFCLPLNKFFIIFYVKQTQLK